MENSYGIEHYEHINQLVTKTANGNDRAFSELLSYYEGLIIKIAKKYYSSSVAWTDWVDELKSQFFIYVAEFDPEKGVFFSYYISQKLGWYAYYQVTKRSKDCLEDAATACDCLSKISYSTDWEAVLDHVRDRFLPEEYEVFRLYYCEGHSQVAVGEGVGKCQYGVSRILAKIRKYLVNHFQGEIILH